MRLLQVLSTTADTPANLNALRVHALLAGDGIEVRTLALGAGDGVVVSAAAPAIAASQRSLAAFTELRRELHWPDVVVAVDCLPRALTGRNTIPVIVMVTPRRSGALARRLAALDRAGTLQVVVPDASLGDAFPGYDTTVIPTAHAAEMSSDERNVVARRAARSQMGVDADDVVVVRLDPGDATMTAVVVGARASLRSVEPDSAGRELLVHGADVVLVGEAPRRHRGRHRRTVAGDGPTPTLVDMMAAGAVPVIEDAPSVGGLSAAGLLVDGTSAVVISAVGASDPTSHDESLLDAVSALAADRERLGRLAAGARRAARRTCDPDDVHRRWTRIIDQALPSQE